MTIATCKKDKRHQADQYNWIKRRIKTEQIEKYLDNGKCFIDGAGIE